jgi:hypothetical protein
MSWSFDRQSAAEVGGPSGRNRREIANRSLPRVPQITQARLATETLAVQLGVGVGLGLVGLIAAPVTVKVFHILGTPHLCAENSSARPTLRSASSLR